MLNKSTASATAGGSTIALCGFLFIFAGFVLYQTSVDAGYFAPHLGGFYTAACALALPFAGYVYLKDIIRTGFGRSGTGWVFAAFLILFAAQIALNVGSADQEITVSHSAFLFKFLVLFMVARMLDPTSKQFAAWILPCFLVVAAVVLRQAYDGGLLVTELARHENPEFMLDYQGIGHAALVLGMFCAPVTRWRFALYILAMPALFLIGARSELVAFLAAASVIELCRTRNPVGAIVIATLLAGAFASGVQLVDLPEHRVFNILKPSQDQSVQERAALAEAAWKTIQDNPIAGAYGSYEKGNYAHNALSAWVDLGVLGFLLLAAVMIAPLGTLLPHFWRERHNPLYVLTLVSFAVSILLLAGAKTFTYQTVPLAIGLYCRWRSTKAGRSATRRRGERLPT